MGVLFVCNQNKHRSKTAEEIFKDKFETRSAGLYNESPVTSEELDWADLVVVMDGEQRKEIGKRFPRQYVSKKIVSLDVKDIYSYMQPELVDELRQNFHSVS